MAVALGKSAIRTEPDVLHVGALATAAVDEERRVQEQPALTSFAADQRGGRMTPAQKTGVGGSLRRSKEDPSKLWLGLLEKGLDTTGDVWKRWATSKGRDQAALEKAVADSIEAMVRAQGTKLAKQAPFGAVILVAFDLSLAFADGVGRALETVNAELRKRYDFVRIGEELDPAGISQIQVMRGYQAEGTKQLSRILREGLADVAVAATEMILQQIGKIPGKVLEDLSAQIAEHMVRQNDLLAVFHEAIDEASGSIPQGRRKVEGLAFKFVAKAFLDQMLDEELAKKLADIPGVGTTDKPVYVALLESLIKILVEGSYDTYGRHVPVEAAKSEAKQLLLETVRGLIAQKGDLEIESSGSTEVIVEEGRIAVPVTWIPALKTPQGTQAERDNRWWARQSEFIDFTKRIGLSLEIRRNRYRQEYARRATADNEYEVFTELQERWRQDVAKAQQRALSAIDPILESEGDPDGHNQRMLEAHVRSYVGFPDTLRTFMKPPWEG